MASNSMFHTLCLDATLQAAWKQVKGKNSAGGIDGVSLAEFERNLYQNLQSIADDLKNGSWKPQPYLQIEVPKKRTDEMRKLGLLSIRDKIVQHGIKSLIEGRAERLFVGNSYGYRKGKGATKAIRRTMAECNMKKNQWVLRLDIDDFFDTVDHAILNARLNALLNNEPEIVRLIMLVIKMGKVSAAGNWVEATQGVPQGAILSPILANLYLHSFDQFVLYRKLSYVRYADDFIILCETKEQAENILLDATKYLQNKLKLSLNEPIISELKSGFEFLGVTIQKHQISVSTEKRNELLERIATLEFEACGFSPKSLKTWEGLCNYYAQLLPQSNLEELDKSLYNRFCLLIEENHKRFVNKSTLQRALGSVAFLSKQYNLDKKKLVTELLDFYLEKKGGEHTKQSTSENQKIIRSRKLEYRKKEAEGSELLVNKPGTFIGLTNRGITVKEKGKVLSQQSIINLSHIVITGKGVSMSSNLLDYCMANKIPIDFFDNQGAHIGSFLSPKFMEDTLWLRQSQASIEVRMKLALNIITGKLKNQFNLIKYFHKYHKKQYTSLGEKYLSLEEWINHYLEFRKNCDLSSPELVVKLRSYESQAAVRYWAYIRELFVDDQIAFEKREHKGATDIVNCMLNYGYAILYVRVWQALLSAKLNPYDSVIHVSQSNKPTFVYDVVELFRSQVVDRIVISMVQKGVDLKLNKGILSDNTRQLLAKNVMERLNRYEKYRGTEMKMQQIIVKQAMEISSYFKDGVLYRPYIAKW